MHVSYRRAEGLFVNRSRDLPASKKHNCAAGLLTVPLISPACQRPKVGPPPYLPLQMDLFFQEFMKSPEFHPFGARNVTFGSIALPLVKPMLLLVFRAPFPLPSSFPAEFRISGAKPGVGAKNGKVSPSDAPGFGLEQKEELAPHLAALAD